MVHNSKFKSIDFYRKIPRDLTEATFSGAWLSIVAAISMIFLFGMELSSYLRVSTVTEIIVDQSHDGDLLRLHFNMSFPALSCEFASVDVTDVLGTARFNLSKTLRKHPINHQYEIVGPQHHKDPVPTPSKHGDDPQDRRVLLDDNDTGALILTEENFKTYSLEYTVLIVNFYAPWCPWSQKLEASWEKAASIMAERHHPENDGRIRLGKVDCTTQQNLCREHHIQGFPSIRIFRKGDDLREIHGHHEHESYYGERDTESLLKMAESLVPAATIEEHEERRGVQEVHESLGIKRRAPQTGGCNIEGFLLVKKVPGNLMVSARGGAHSFDASTMNMTHYVHEFGFGRHLHGRRKHDAERLLPKHDLTLQQPGRITNHFFMSFHDNVTHDHFLQVVMTEVEPLGMPAHPASRLRLRTGLQTYDYTVHSNTFQSDNVPVARFHYELSPMQVLITETRRSFSHFITNVCAIVGGVFTVAGIIDGITHHTIGMIKKIELGKQN